MRVLVTGATGFIGAHALAALAARDDVEVIAAARRPPASGVRLHPAAVDLLAPGAAAALVAEWRPSHLLHLAWEARPGRFWTAPENLDWCAASLDLVHRFAEAGGARAVIAGSVAEYAWDRPLLREEVADAGSPATLYGVAKDALRRLLFRWSEAPGAGAPSIGWGRVFWLYGPGEPAGRLVSDLVAAFAAGREVATSSGAQERDFLHVADVAGALVAALGSDHHGPFNIGSGEGVAVREVATRLAALAGRPDLLRLGARPDAAHEPPRLVADPTLLRDQIGYVPRHTLDEGLAATWAAASAERRDRARAIR